jgi:hypothetical protein
MRTEPFAEAALDVVANLAKKIKLHPWVETRRGWVRNRPMDALDARRENRAVSRRVVAKRNHVVELPGDVSNPLGPLAGNLNSLLAENLNGERVNPLWIRT